MNITYWSDYACPFCYIGVTHLLKAAKALGEQDNIELHMRSFELDPRASKVCDSDTVARFGAKYGLSHDEAAACVEEISELGCEAGLDFNYATTRSTSTFDAHRLTKLAQATSEAMALNLEHQLYDAYFGKNLELADHDVLRSVGLRAGLDERDVNRVLASDEYADDVRRDEREAAKLGICGVPYFVIAGKTTVPGCMSVESYQKVLKDAFAEERATQVLTSFGVCGPDGCMF